MADPGTGLLDVDQIEEILTDLVAEAAGLSRGALDPHKALRDLGLSAMQIAALPHRLGERGGPFIPSRWSEQESIYTLSADLAAEASRLSR